jgi:sugar lactone lactonase YvrE
LTPDPTGLTGGTHSGSVTFSAQVNGDTVSANVPVTFNQESHKLLVDGNGVGFASMPTVSKLTRTLRVRDNLGLATSWSAASDQTWLTVTPSGTAGDDLVLTANPASLTADTLNLATVTITSPDASVENTEKVRVGFWVGSTDPTTTPTTVTTANVAADPIRPYAYTAVGGDIRVYHVHTGSLVTTITGVSTGAVGFMTVSHDGSTLYALDTTNSKVVPVDLDTLAVGTPFSINAVNPIKVIDYTRTNGVEVILSGNGGQIFNAKTGTLLFSGFAGNTVVAASRGGTRMCTVDVGISAYSISCPSLDFTSLNGGQLLLGNTFTVSGVSGNGQDVAMKADGTLLYVASGGVTELSAYTTAGQNPAYAGSGSSPKPTGLHPNNAEIAADGRIFASAANPVFDPADVWIFTAAGTPITTLKIAAGGVDQIFTRQLRISGDGLRLITITGDPFNNTNVKLNFTTIP